MEKDEILDSALKELFDVAFKDGVVDDKEFELIQQVEISIEAYAEYLNRALLDNVITPAESKELERLRDKVMTDAHAIATEDGVIDEEEGELLRTLTKIFRKYDPQG